MKEGSLGGEAAPPAPGVAEATGLRLILSLAGRLYHGSLEICLADGRSRRFEGREAGPHAVLILRNGKVARRFLASGRNVDFIQTYIFPGGMLPSPQALAEQVRRAGLEAEAAFTFGPSYARTLRLWNDRFQAVWPRVRELGFAERFRRIWTYYLAYCEAVFPTGSIDVTQVALRPA